MVAALERVRLFRVPEPTGSLGGDVEALFLPWCGVPRRDERAVAAVLSAAEWSGPLKRAVLAVFDRPLGQVTGAILARAALEEEPCPQRLETLNWLLRGVALDRLPGGALRSRVDLTVLAGHLLDGLRSRRRGVPGPAGSPSG